MREARINKHSIQSAHRAAVASNLDRIADAVPDALDFDRGKVEAVKDALARGVYEINVERIAEKLMRIDTTLRGNGPGRG